VYIYSSRFIRKRRRKEKKVDFNLMFLNHCIRWIEDGMLADCGGRLSLWEAARWLSPRVPQAAYLNQEQDDGQSREREIHGKEAVGSW
jgi:hypothetical protein